MGFRNTQMNGKVCVFFLLDSKPIAFISSFRGVVTNETQGPKDQIIV